MKGCLLPIINPQGTEYLMVLGYEKVRVLYLGYVFLLEGWITG